MYPTLGRNRQIIILYNIQFGRSSRRTFIIFKNSTWLSMKNPNLRKKGNAIFTYLFGFIQKLKNRTLQSLDKLQDKTSRFFFMIVESKNINFYDFEFKFIILHNITMQKKYKTILYIFTVFSPGIPMFYVTLYLSLDTEKNDSTSIYSFSPGSDAQRLYSK